MKQAQNPNTDVEQIVSAPKTPASMLRRKLIAGSAATPLLMTITSRPVWAGGNTCTPSALASANLSGQHEDVGCGISAGWWKEKPDSWPISKNTRFHDLFAFVRYKEVILYQNKTLFDVINETGASDSNPGNIGLHLVGAYLNALTFPKQGSKRGYAFTDQDIIKAFNFLDNGKSKDFSALKDTLYTANNRYDSTSPKP